MAAMKNAAGFFIRFVWPFFYFYSKPPPAPATFVHYNVLSPISLKVLLCFYRSAHFYSPYPP